MTIENAILELAAAIRYHADKPAGGTGSIAKLIENVTVDPQAEQKAVMAKVEADRKAAIAEAKPTTAKEAVQEALAKAKAEKAAPAPEAEDSNLLGGEEEAEAKVLDWKADVLPVLAEVGKDKPKLAGLLAEFDVGAGKTYKTANLLPPETFPALVAAAKKLLG